LAYFSKAENTFVAISSLAEVLGEDTSTWVVVAVISLKNKPTGVVSTSDT
jgi:hypothetical protein